jgi:hypothetical protein
MDNPGLSRDTSGVAIHFALVGVYTRLLVGSRRMPGQQVELKA